MKKYMLGLLLVVAMVMVVSCSQDSLAQDDLVSVHFSKLEARAIDNDVYSVTGDATWESASVEIGGVEDYWWTYKATKNDDGFKTGEQTTFANWSDGKGLSGSKQFSVGSWKFELKAYASEADRTDGTKAIFTGEATTGKLTNSTTVSVPMSFTYVEGTGTAKFEISTTIVQPEGNTYAISKVEMVIGGKTVNLTKGDSNWSGSVSGVASGRQKVEIKVYVDNETGARVSKEIGTAYIMHGMTTDVTGSATVTLTANTVDVTFDPTIPSSVLVRAPEGTAVGDTLTIGKVGNPPSYLTSGDSSKCYPGKDISWKVLKVADGKALVISEKILYLDWYTGTATSKISKWSESCINEFLNGDFISNYGLGNVSIVDPAEGEVGADAETEVFLLSVDEAKALYSTSDARIARDYTDDANACAWWLRSEGKKAGSMYVSITGDFVEDGAATNSSFGVRPAFWIDIE